MAGRGLSVFVNIGAKMLPSLSATASAAERRIGQMGRGMRLEAAKTKLAFKEMASAMKPVAGMMAAGGLSMGFVKAIGDSSHLAHELQMLRNAGRTAGEVGSAMAAANRTIAALPTTTLIDNLKVLNETTGAFGSFQHAMDNLTFNQSVGSMMQNMLGDKAGSPGEMFNNIARAMEMRGAAQDHVRYQREVGAIYKAMVFTGGRVNPEEVFNFSQQSNPYIKGYSLRYLSRIAPSLIQEFGGDKAGTMSSTWAGTILGKAKNKISTEAWMGLGLLDPKGVVSNKVGPVGWKPGAIRGTDLALSDPLKWSETILIPALKAHGFKMDDQLSLAKALMPLFRDRNANRLANVLVYDRDRVRLHKDEALINRVPGVDKAYGDTLRRDPLKAWTALKSSFTNLSSVLFGTGRRESPVAVAMVNIARGINAAAAAIEKHPNLGQFLGGMLGFGAAVATLKTFGVALRWAFSPLKWLFAPIRIIGTALAEGLGPTVVRAVLSFGPALLNGLMALAPIVMEGLAAAFALLSNPIGWAVILAGVGLALAYYFRDDLANAWHVLVDWFKDAAWSPVKGQMLAAFLGFGPGIVGSLISGLSQAWPTLSSWFGQKWAALKASVTSIFAANAAPVAEPAPHLMGAAHIKLAGARAKGGPVDGSKPYLVGERGPEVIVPGRAGIVIPHSELTARRAARAAGGDFKPTIIINGITEPGAVGREVERVIRRYASQQSANLSD